MAKQSSGRRIGGACTKVTELHITDVSPEALAGAHSLLPDAARDHGETSLSNMVAVASVLDKYGPAIQQAIEASGPERVRQMDGLLSIIDIVHKTENPQI